MTTTIRVSRDLRDRLARRARERSTSLAEVIEHALATEEEASFWSEVRSTMTTRETRTALTHEVEAAGGAVRDGLEVDDDWSAIL